MSDARDVEIATDDDVVRVRRAVRELAVEAGLSLVEQTKMVTAASELARNTLLHGGGGVAHLGLVEEAGRRGVRAEFVDDGPGIPDIDLAVSEGYTTGTGLGLGLPGARRLADRFEIASEVGHGTRVTITKWAR